ncbi:MAG: electron transfer flavoprotein subunit alpha/FixB family protein [Syntrophobacterales bacterium]|nr:electron transfer flavoprotein subunit alpha/FixB family protein [Syntrophobacterales bacterium]
MTEKKRGIWIFGDYRNYFQNRVTIQLIARARELAVQIDAEVSVIVFGSGVDEYVKEYISHGADRIYLTDNPRLAEYSMETYSFLMERLARREKPEIILIGATAFGREFAPHVAKRLGTGLTADCIGLDIDETGLLVQRAPSFGGKLIAEVIIPERRPQMATVHPGIFQELPHDAARAAEIVNVPMPENMPSDRIRIISVERCPVKEDNLEHAKIVVCGGRGMGNKKKFAKLYELAELLGGEVGATRPVVYLNWVGREAMVGQAGKQIRPNILFSFGISGAMQHTASINNAKFIIAVNKNPNAPIMRMADVAIVADASQICNSLIAELKRRIRG